MSLRTLIQAKIDMADAHVNVCALELVSAQTESAVHKTAMEDAIKNFADWVDYEPQSVKDKADALVAEANKYA